MTPQIQAGIGQCRTALGRSNQDRQRTQPVERRQKPPLGRPVGIEPQMREATHNGADGEWSFQPRQWCPETEVRSRTERVVADDVATDIESLRVGHTLRVAIGGGQRYKNDLALWNRTAFNLNVVKRDPARSEYG